MAKDDIRKFEFKPLLSGRTETEVITQDRSRVLSIPGCAFRPKCGHTDNTLIDTEEGHITALADAINFVCPLNLPDKAKIVYVAVYGNATAAAETWSMNKCPRPYDANTVMAAALINTANASITNAVIDNTLNSYTLSTTSLDTNDTIYSALVKYTV